MLWRNQITGVTVRSDRKMGYPYVRVPEPSHKAVLSPAAKVVDQPRIDIIVERDESGRFLPRDETEEE